MMLVVPIKKPYDVEVSKPLKNLLLSSYSLGEKSSDFTNAAEEFGKLRKKAINKVFDKTESSLSIMYNYYDQICALECKIPVQELQIPFKYKNAFDDGSLFGTKSSMTLSSLAFEKMCTLFNIAATQSAIAASQTFDTDEGLQLAVKLLQLASGIFNQLKHLSSSSLPVQPTSDLNTSCLQVLSNLMLAQAQEVFIIKLIKDNGKELLIAKLCANCEEMYADVLKLMQKDSLRNLWEKEWVPNVAGKQAGFHAMLFFFMSLNYRSNKQIGKEISCLQKSIELFKAAQQRSGDVTLFEEFSVKAQKNLVDSKRDNDFIYNEQIPNVNDLETPGKLLVAKPTTIGNQLGKEFKDIFNDLVPVALHKALIASEAKKNEIVNGEVMKLREATQSLNAILSSLNLPAAVEEVTKGSSLPPSVVEKSSSFQSKGGINYLQSLIDQLPCALERNQQILDEAERMLKDEEASDDNLRTQFKQSWTRVQSKTLTENFRINASKYREIINNAIVADKTVREKFEKHFDGMELLALSPEELQKAIPMGAAKKEELASVSMLRALLEKLDVLKCERDTLESDLKSVDVNVKDAFSQVFSAMTIDEATVSSEVMKVLQPYQMRVQSSLKTQEKLVAEIQEKHNQFIHESGLGTTVRDGLLKQLATAYDVFIELQNNLKEGIKFYNDLTELLIVFQNKIADFCFARKTEKEELMKDLTNASSRDTAASIPSLPAHHTDVTLSNTNVSATAPYPVNVQNMPLPYASSNPNMYAMYMPPPLPQSFNPYATIPYPTGYNYAPGNPQFYGTWPSNPANQNKDNK